MADTTTTTYGLTKPEVGASEDTWGGKLNTNLDSLDDLLDGTSTLLGPKLNSNTTIVDATDGTKVAQFAVSGITTATTRTFTFPDASGTVSLNSNAETVSGNKTYTGAVDLSGATLTLAAGEIGAADLATDAVTTAKILDANVTTAKIADDAVTDAKVLNPSGMVFISSQDASASATLDFTGFDASKYDGYMFVLGNVTPATDNVQLYMRTSTDGGSTYDAGSSDYRYGWNRQQMFATSPTNDYRSAGNSAFVEIGVSIGNAANEDGWSGRVTLFCPHLAKVTFFEYSGSYVNDATQYFRANGHAARASSADVDAVRFLFSSGNIASGTITMYGLRNS